MIIVLMMIMMLLRDKTFSFSCRVDKLKECFCVRAERWSDQAAPTVISDICVCTACCPFPVFLLYFFIVFLWYFFDIFVCTVVCPFVPVFLYILCLLSLRQSLSNAAKCIVVTLSMYFYYWTFMFACILCFYMFKLLTDSFSHMT